MTTRFELTPSHAAPHEAIELRGEVDATNAAEFEARLTARASSGPVILDLSAAAYFDSAAFEVLDRLIAGGAVSVVISTASVVRRAASVMSLPYHDTVGEARAALSASG